MPVPKYFPSINYDFRPNSYWGPAASPLEAALRNVKGRNRRQMIRDYHAKGLLPALSDDLLRETLDEDTRRSLDRIHPSFMGGEYLPDYHRDEVETTFLVHSCRLFGAKSCCLCLKQFGTCTAA